MELKKLVEEFNRMVDFYDDSTECPFYEETGYTDWEDWWIFGSENPEKFEQIIQDFVKEHPAPIYPTILELLRYIALSLGSEYTNMPLNELVKLRLPQEIAEEWGILPINECGLTKHVDEYEDVNESEWR